MTLVCISLYVCSVCLSFVISDLLYAMGLVALNERFYSILSSISTHDTMLLLSKDGGCFYQNNKLADVVAVISEEIIAPSTPLCYDVVTCEVKLFRNNFDVLHVLHM